MPFPYNEDHTISFTAAASLTKNYRDSMREGARLGGYFSADAMEQLLEQTNCVGIRFYYGLTSDNKQQIVAVGVDIDGNDLVGEDYCCMDMSIPCPQSCSEDNMLNS